MNLTVTVLHQSSSMLILYFMMNSDSLEQSSSPSKKTWPGLEVGSNFGRMHLLLQHLEGDHPRLCISQGLEQLAKPFAMRLSIAVGRLGVGASASRNGHIHSDRFDVI